MVTAKHILSISLIAMVICSGFPLVSREDANGDRRIDLRDVILQVRDLTSAVDQPEAFSSSIDKVVQTFSIVAGLKSGISQFGKTESTTGAHSLDPTYLTSSIGLLPISIQVTRLPELTVNPSSILIVPDTPPPRTT